MKVQVIIVAAGSGVRFKSKIPKPFVLLKSRPLIAYSLAVFEKAKAIDSVIIAGHKDFLNRFKNLGRTFKKLKVIVPGGATRAESVQCGLAAVDEDATHVLVHDAARPLVDGAMIDRILAALKKDKAVIVAVPVKSTIKRVNPKTMIVEDTPARDLLWDVQTPQGFHKDVLIKAHARFKGDATDDAMMVESFGIKVKVVMGDYRNIKITTPEDLNIAKGLI
jgi:2-C-methyl-D-erythritol 4-phosphate cytidylyltransferase